MIYTEKIQKSAGLNENKNNALERDDIDKINAFTKCEVNEDDIYIFKAVLCDNEVDRDNEAFTFSALKEMEKLFIGKTVIFDHNPSAENQCGRIFSAEVKTDYERKTELGEKYTYLEAKAYIPKTEENDEIISKIEMGILREMSISGQVKRKICSICGKENCSHHKGKTYNGRKCVIRLDGASDAYEISFVAIPSQRNAGVIKKFGESEIEINDSDTYELSLSKDELEYLKSVVKAGIGYRKKLSAKIRKYGLMAMSGINTELLDSICSSLEINELEKLSEEIKKTAEKLYPNFGEKIFAPQTAQRGKHFRKAENEEFTFR